MSSCSFTALFLTFADLKIAVQTKSAGADEKLESRPPKSSESEVAEPADEEIVTPKVPTEFQPANSETQSLSGLFGAV